LEKEDEDSLAEEASEGAETRRVSNSTLSDFRMLEEVGHGSFGTVRLVEKDNYRYALKELSKARVIEVRDRPLL
jgi:serine/threonine protein kinase